MKTRLFHFTMVLVLVLLVACAPLPTPASQPAVAQPSSNSSNNTSANIVSESYWQSFLEIMSYPICGTNIQIIPFDLSQSNPASQIIEAWREKSPNESWLVAPDGNGQFSFYVDITSKSDQEWVELEKSISIEVKTSSISGQTANAFKFPPACGGGQNVRDFSSFDLQTDFQKYVTKTSSNDFDFYTLQPGEWERFNIPFQCREPGYYDITAQIHFRYDNEDGVIETTLAKVSCPQKFTVLTVDGIDSKTATVIDSETFEWNNGDYKIVP
jgi:hypothetical protein